MDTYSREINQIYSSSLSKRADKVSKGTLWVILALTAHTIIIAVLIGTYRYVTQDDGKLVLEMGSQWNFPDVSKGDEKEVEFEEKVSDIDTPDEEEIPEEPTEDPIPEAPVENLEPDLGLKGEPSGNESKPVSAKYNSRQGDAKEKALGKYGGDESTEAAVADALAWLARHQSSDGGWNLDGYHQVCGNTACTHKGDSRMAPIYDSAVTALSLLSFLGAGYDDSHGRYKDNIKQAINYLLAHQQDDGALVLYRRHHIVYPMYDHTLALYALAEAYNINMDVRLKRPIQEGLGFLMQVQQAGGGWDYEPVPNTGRNDLSITGWAVMALESCRLGGFEIAPETYRKIRRRFHRQTLTNGQVKYANKQPGLNKKSIGITAVAVYSRLLLGDTTKSRTLRLGLDAIADQPPKWSTLINDRKEEHTMYYWYYGTLAMFNAGDQKWREWNRRLKNTLVSNQRKSGCTRGSWNPAGSWLGDFSGRVYATAICCLSLEVYYRYLPLYQKDTRELKNWLNNFDDIMDENDWVTALQASGTETKKCKQILREITQALRKTSSLDEPELMSEEMTAAVIASAARATDVMLKYSSYKLLNEYGQGKEQLIGFFRGELLRCSKDSLPTIVNVLVNFNAQQAVPDLINKMADDNLDQQRISKIHTGLVSLTGETDISPDYKSWQAWYIAAKN
ncbi:prenyltransferase/squalene oxidase repeat-containing protein [Planctomycetota bacterium]